MILLPFFFLGLAAVVICIVAPVGALIIVRFCLALRGRWDWKGELAGWLTSVAILLAGVYLFRVGLEFDEATPNVDEIDWVVSATEVLVSQILALATLVFAMAFRLDRQITRLKKAKGH